MMVVIYLMLKYYNANLFKTSDIKTNSSDTNLIGGRTFKTAVTTHYLNSLLMLTSL